MIALLLLGAIDMAAVKAEPDSIKRGFLALDYAFERLADARKQAGEGGTVEAFKAAADEVAAGAEFSVEAFKSGRRKTGDFKKAEVRTRDLLRRLETLRQDAPLDDRPLVEAVEKRVRAVQEELLSMVLGRR
ncbi:MAG: hypothetical protein SFV18_09885 [Bryobacteraceae bacterium]|nr:hypothetical protein [Bryobacteraceae bacterium]